MGPIRLKQILPVFSFLGASSLVFSIFRKMAINTKAKTIIKNPTAVIGAKPETNKAVRAAAEATSPME